jgi:hypothetical protein
MGDVERCDALGWRCIPHACFVNVIALYPFG